MAYYSQNGTGIDSEAYIYVQLQVTRTDYDTYSRFTVKSVAVSNTGTSSYIRGQVTTNQNGTSWTAATGWKSVSYNGTTTLATATFDVTRGATDKTAVCKAYAEGGGSGIYAGGTDYATLYVTVPKVESPNAPSGCSASYVSDSSASITWTNGSTTTARPRTATLIERQTDGGSWVQVASVGSSVSNWTDNGISGNHSYLYRVRAQNSAGYSAYSTAPSIIYTTPAAPSEVLLDKTAATTVQLDVSGSWPYASTFDVQSTYDNGTTWVDEESGESVPVNITVNAGTVQFRVRAVMGDLRSDWTISSPLVTITPPLAPTITSRPNGNVPNGSTVTIGWAPNHPDGSAQESAQVKVTDPNGTSTTYNVNAMSWTSSALAANGAYSAQIRTKGLDPDWGAWSDSVSWGVYNLPSVAILTPSVDGSTVDQLPYSITWQVTDPTGVSAQRIIVSDGSELLNVQPSPDSRSFSMTASNVNLENGGSYTITLRVMGGSGLITTQTRTFGVVWTPPTPPTVYISEDGNSASIQIADTRFTESGTVLEASSAMMESLTIHGLSVQDGTPTPSAPVAIESVQPANKLDTAGTFTKANTTYNGCTITNNGDGTYTVEGTNTSGGWYFNSSSGSVALPAGTYTVCGGSELTGCTLYVYVGGSRRPSGSTFTLDSTENITKWAIYVDDYATISGTAAPALVTGGEVRPFVPYGSIAIVGDSATPSATPIPVTLRSLPDGTHDEWVSGESADTLVQRVGSVVFDGSSDENWNVEVVGTIGSNFYIAVSDAARGTYGNRIMLTLCQACTSNSAQKDRGFISNGGNLNLTVGGTLGISTVADFKTWLSTNPVTAIYPLATPVTTTLAHVALPYVDGSAWVDAEVTPQIEATFRPVDFPDQPAADSVDVVRVNADGSTWTVASGLSVGDTAIDPLPPLGVDYTYKIIASAVSGATSSADVVEKMGGCRWALNFGQAASVCRLVGRNPSYNVGYTHGGELYHFARGFQNPEDMLPEFYPVGSVDASGTLEFDAESRADADEIMALMFRYPVAWLRTPFGERRRVRLSPNYNLDRRTKRISVSFDLIRFGEAW